jgi:O-acetyl-ADP-ribose deacetylase (regulator of RNase III)
VIHTVGPVWWRGRRGEPELLVACYRHSLALADEHGLTSIAFPSISTGVYGYPIDQACRIALQTTADYLSEDPNTSIEQVTFCTFGERDFGIYQQMLKELS